MIAGASIGETAVGAPRDRLGSSSFNVSSSAYIQSPMVEMLTTQDDVLVFAVELYPTLSSDRMIPSSPAVVSEPIYTEADISIAAKKKTTNILAATESQDRAAIVGNLPLGGTLAATGAPDTAAVAGAVSGAATVPSDALLAEDGAALLTESGEFLTLDNTTPTGVLSATETADVAAVAGRIPATGALAATEAQDQANILGTPSASVTWNPADKEGTIVLSGGNLTATKGGATAGDAVARATLVRSGTGDWYFEVTPTIATSGFVGIGVADSGAFLGNYLGIDDHSIGYYQDGSIYFQNVSLSGTSFTASDKIGVRFKAATGDVLHYKNGTLVRTTPTGIVAAYPAIGVYRPGDAGVLNAGGSALTLPAGSSRWDGSNPSGGPTGGLAATEAADVPSISGSASGGITGTLAATGVADTGAASGAVASTGTLSATEAGDVAAVAGRIPATGTLAATETADAASVSGTASGGSVAYTWNPSDVGSADLAFTNGDLTVTNNGSGAGDKCVRGTQSRSGSSEWYYEVTPTIGTSGFVGIGIARASASLVNYLGIDGNSVAYYQDGNIYINNINTSAASFTGSDKIGVHFKPASGDVLFYKNGTLVATRSTSITTGYPALGTYRPGDGGTANFGATTLTLPSGASKWNGT